MRTRTFASKMYITDCATRRETFPFSKHNLALKNVRAYLTYLVLYAARIIYADFETSNKTRSRDKRSFLFRGISFKCPLPGERMRKPVMEKSVHARCTYIALNISQRLQITTLQIVNFSPCLLSLDVFLIKYIWHKIHLVVILIAFKI